MDKHLRPSLVEMIGTFALVFVGAGTVCVSRMVPESDPAYPGLAGIALAQGLVYAALLAITVPVAGGFLNPAVALTLWVFRRLEGRAALWLIGAQFVGAILGAFCVRLIFAEDVLRPARCGTPHLNLAAFVAGGQHNFLRSVITGVGVELVLTFLLTFAIFGTVLDPRAPDLGGLGAGLTLAGLIFFGYQLTGAALNPARWLGPVLWELSIPGMEAEALRDHAVYWIGPVFGALLAGAVYHFLILPESADPDVDVEPAAEAAGKTK